MFRRTRSLIASLTTGLLAASLLVAVAAPAIAAATKTATDPCATANDENNLQVRPSHGGVFYIDSGITPKLDAAYVGYSVTNTSGAGVTNLWVKLSNFSGSVVSLVNPADSVQQIPSIAASGYKTAFFLLKASGLTSTAQSHLVQVYQGRPDLSGSSLVYNCTFTFSKVMETIKAAANKVDSALVSSLLPETPALGGTVTITVKGQTGTIGSGTSSPDGKIFWATPAAYSTWPTRSLRLESTSLRFFDTSTLRDGNLDASLLVAQITDKLKVDWATTFGSRTSNTYYRADFTFKIIGGGGTISPMPINQISSGTQIKHTDTNSISGGSFSLSGVSSGAVTTRKTAGTPTVATGVITVPFTLTVSTDNLDYLYLDEVVDLPSAGATYVANSGRLTQDGVVGTSAFNPSTSGTELHFVGPFKLKDGRNLVITYSMTYPCPATDTEVNYTNSAYSVAGDVRSGASATQQDQVTIKAKDVATTCSGTASTALIGKSPSVSTNPATSVTTTTATINGTANAEGNSGVTVRFSWGTTSSVGTNASPSPATLTNGSTTDTSFSYGLTGLTAGTTYYFRLEIVGGALGAVLSFTTPTVGPLAITGEASSILQTSATLNGQYLSRNTRLKAVEFQYNTSSTLSGTLTTVAAVVANSTLSASTNSYEAAKAISSLTVNTDYYFRIRVQCWTAAECPNSGYAYGAISTFKTLDAGVTPTDVTLEQYVRWNQVGSITVDRTNVPNTIPDQTYGSGPFTLSGYSYKKDSTTPTGLTPTYDSDTPLVCDFDATGKLIFLKAGVCTLQIGQPGGEGSDGDYGPATDVALTFNILEAPAPVFDGPYPQTITFPPVNNMPWGNPNPSSNPTASSGLPVTVTNNTPTVCTWAAPGVITILSVGTCSLTATQPGNGYWLPATPVTITFEITKKEAVVTVDPASKQQGQVDPVCTYVITGVVPGVTIIGITCSRTPGETPGTYPVTPAGGNFGANYTVTYRPGNLTITPAQNVAPSPGGSYTPVTMNLTTLTWQPSPSVGATYQINLNGRTVCTTAATNCTVNQIVGPKSKVEVAALLASLKSPLVKLTYRFDKPIVAVTVYFDVDKSKIKPADAKEVKRVTTILKREGFDKFSVEGHTDSDASAGYNLALSGRRNVALKAESVKLLPKGKYDLTPKGLTDPAADNNSALGKAKNRRATLFISG